MLSLTIFDLPEEIIIKLFSYLEPQYLLNSVSDVCQEWRRLVRTAKLWLHRTAVIGPCKILDRNQFVILPNQLHKIPHIRSVKIECGHDCAEVSLHNRLTYSLLCLKANCSCIDSVELNNLSAESQSSFHSLSHSYPDIKVLKLFNINYFNFAKPPHRELSLFKKLETLEIDVPDHHLHDNASEWLELVTCHSSVCKVWFANEPLLEDFLLKLLWVKSDCLEELGFVGDNITDLGFTAINRCHKLREVSIYGAWNMTILGLNALSNMIALRKLTLIIFNIKWEDLFIWLQTSRTAKNLQELSLGNGILVGTEIFQALGNLKNLRKLTLFDLDVSQEDLSLWLETSPTVRNLTELHLPDYCRVWDTCLDKSIAMISGKNMVFSLTE